MHQFTNSYVFYSTNVKTSMNGLKKIQHQRIRISSNSTHRYSLQLQVYIPLIVNRQQQTQIVVLVKGYIVLPRSRVSGWTTVAMSAVSEDSD